VRHLVAVQERAERREVASDRMFGDLVRTHMTRKTLIAFALVALAGAPALAEIDLSGSWQSINHEDALERGAGPNPDDWAGLPLNESGRGKAFSFSQSMISMPGRTRWVHT